MGEIKTRAIVLGTADYGEQDRILTLFSPEYGRIDAKARSCRKAASPLLPAVQPFTYGDYELFRYKEKTAVRQCEVIETFYPLREDVGRFSAAGFAAALCRSAVQPDEKNEPLFGLFYRVCSYLAYGENDAADMLITFLIRFLSLMGFEPSLTRCALCGRDLRKQKTLRFSAEKGGALCFDCGTFEKSVSALAMEALRRILLLEENELDRVRLKEPLRAELLPLLRDMALVYSPGAEKAARMLDMLL